MHGRFGINIITQSVSVRVLFTGVGFPGIDNAVVIGVLDSVMERVTVTVHTACAGAGRVFQGIDKAVAIGIGHIRMKRVHSVADLEAVGKAVSIRVIVFGIGFPAVHDTIVVGIFHTVTDAVVVRVRIRCIGFINIPAAIMIAVLDAVRDTVSVRIGDQGVAGGCWIGIGMKNSAVGIRAARPLVAEFRAVPYTVSIRIMVTGIGFSGINRAVMVGVLDIVRDTVVVRVTAC